MAAAAILGAGKVGQALAERLILGHVAVRFGVRDPEGARAELSDRFADVPVLSPADAARDAEILLVAVPAAAAIDAVRSAGRLVDKIVVDCTNPVRWDNGPVWAPPARGSVAEALAAAVPEAVIVKGFNHFGAEVQRDPAFPAGPADAFFAGDDHGAKARVMALAGVMGFQPHDAGPLRNAALLENMAVLWIHLASFGGLGRAFAFRVETREHA